MRVDLPIANGFYVSDSLPLSAQRSVNWQPNVPQTSTQTQANLFPTPGLLQLLTLSDLKTCRGAHVMADIAYYVIGQNLYRLNLTVVDGVDTFTTDDLGTIEGVDRVTMSDNGIQLCITAAPDASTLGKSYIFTDDPDTLTEITDPDFDGPAIFNVYIDGFFVFAKSDGKKFFNSQLNDGLNYDALDFQTANADPDQIRALAVYNNQLYVLGSETTEVFRNIGRSPSPFVRLQGAVIDVGIFSPQSIANFADTLVFVGGALNESPAIWAVAGGRKQKISTTAIDNELSKLTQSQLSDLFAWKYAESGAYFYGVTLSDTTFVYDSINSRWHERQSIEENDLGKYRVSHMITAYGRVLVGDIQDGRIGELKEDLYTEYNQLVRRFITTQPFDNTGNPLFVGEIEAVCEAGVGLTNDIQVQSGTTESGDINVMAGKDPQITIAWSKDGGRTYNGWLSRSLGKIGEYMLRQVWRGIPGRITRSIVLLFEISAPVKAVLIKAEADIDG